MQTVEDLGKSQIQKLQSVNTALEGKQNNGLVKVKQKWDSSNPGLFQTWKW